MKKALIIVQNKNSTTKKFGEEIAPFVLHRGLSAELIPINGFEPKKLEDADYLLLGGWRNDSLFSLKRPDNEWVSLVKKLPALDGVKTALFTTYKFFSGGMLITSKTCNEKFFWGLILQTHMQSFIVITVNCIPYCSI